ncbi:hypothetical protein P4S72_03975 [Vibrio sp. PP-XX7]
MHGKAWIDHGKHGNAIAYVWLFAQRNVGMNRRKVYVMILVTVLVLSRWS